MDKLPTVDAAGQVSLSRQTSALERTKSLSKQEVKDAKDVEKAAGGFEALLLHQMLKSMWETVESGNLLGEDSNQSQIYRDMLNQAIADSISEGRGIGVKDFLKKELLKQSKDASNSVEAPNELEASRVRKHELSFDTKD